MKKRDILNTLASNQLQAFETSYVLDKECDVVLKDLESFVEFCRASNQKIVFHRIDTVELEDYVIDIDTAREQIQELVEQKIEGNYFEDGEELAVADFQEEIEQEMDNLKKHNAEVTRKISALNEPEVLFADVFTLYCGTSVGVTLYGSYMDDYPLAIEFEDDQLEEIVDRLMETKLSQYALNSAPNPIELMEEWRRKEEKNGKR